MNWLEENINVKKMQQGWRAMKARKERRKKKKKNSPHECESFTIISTPEKKKLKLG